MKNTGYRFWKARGISYANGEWEQIEMEFELFKPIDDEWERMKFENFLNMHFLIWKGKEIMPCSIHVIPKYYSKITYTVK